MKKLLNKNIILIIIVLSIFLFFGGSSFILAYTCSGSCFLCFHRYESSIMAIFHICPMEYVLDGLLIGGAIAYVRKDTLKYLSVVLILLILLWFLIEYTTLLEFYLYELNINIWRIIGLCIGLFFLFILKKRV